MKISWSLTVGITGLVLVLWVGPSWAQGTNSTKGDARRNTAGGTRKGPETDRTVQEGPRDVGRGGVRSSERPRTDTGGERPGAQTRPAPITPRAESDLPKAGRAGTGGREAGEPRDVNQGRPSGVDVREPAGVRERDEKK
jgi:hypothetical protein